MQKEEYEEWMCIDEDIPLAATLTDLEICQVKVDDSDGCEWVEENPPTKAEMRQALGVQYRSTNFRKQYEVEKRRIHITGVHGDPDEFFDSVLKLTIIFGVYEFDLSFLKVTHASTWMV
ncbi:hypothetical protein AVEN_163485-1 [Araneus ventricosus]|uniref:Uncharacterized protein n=1 Tax=Araneus ventricosus TaxID=182803 RepID=A0A4Y2BSK4_ARAVE|nr:hypothetical protein AVEN_163485-1 [Araneus ventricosus]